MFHLTSEQETPATNEADLSSAAKSKDCRGDLGNALLASTVDVLAVQHFRGGARHSERQTEERGDLARRICRRHTFSEVAVVSSGT
jgi:hypothetical protein